MLLANEVVLGPVQTIDTGREAPLQIPVQPVLILEVVVPAGGEYDEVIPVLVHYRGRLPGTGPIRHSPGRVERSAQFVDE